jgi:hypothetical protein
VWRSARYHGWLDIVDGMASWRWHRRTPELSWRPATRGTREEEERRGRGAPFQRPGRHRNTTKHAAILDRKPEESHHCEDLRLPCRFVKMHVFIGRQCRNKSGQTSALMQLLD